MFKKLWEAITGSKENFEIIATVTDRIEWSFMTTKKKHSEDKITWYLEQGDKGTRRYTFHSYGETAAKKAEKNYEEPMIFWQRTGILPERAEPVEFTAIKRAAAK